VSSKNETVIYQAILSKLQTFHSFLPASQKPQTNFLLPRDYVKIIKMKTHLPAVLTLILGLLVMAGLLYLGALAQNWVAPLCFLGVAVVFHTWMAQLQRLLARNLKGWDEDDDKPIFPG
jgi:hypothetical protein